MRDAFTPERDPIQNLIDGAFVHLFDYNSRASELNRDDFLEERYIDSVAHHLDESEKIDLMLLMEAADAGIIELDLNCVRATWGAEKLEYPKELFSNEVLRSLGVVNIRTRNTAEHILRQVDFTKPKWVRAMQAIEQMAYEAYLRTPARKDGTPYYMHALDSAAFLHWVMTDNPERQLPTGPTRPRTAEVLGGGAVALGHDIVEEHRKTEHYYSLRENVRVYTPRLAREILIMCGINRSDAIHISNGIRLITHEKQEQWMQSYPEYTARLSSNRDAVLAKVAEGHNNSVVNDKPLPLQIDGEPDEIYEKRLEAARQKRDGKKAQQLEVVFGRLLTESPNPKNVFKYHKAERFRTYGPGVVEQIRSSVVTDDLRRLYPSQDFTGAVSPEEFKHTILPRARMHLREAFSLPIRYSTL